MTKALYTAKATVTGGRLAGHGETSDGQLEVDLRLPKELGGEGDGTNPEELFAVGYAACFESALGTVARRAKKEVGDVSVDSSVSLVTTDDRAFTVAVAPLRRRRGRGRARARRAQGLPVLERHAREHRRDAHRERQAGVIAAPGVRRGHTRPRRQLGVVDLVAARREHVPV
jgi:Ohr subfamily peroxiredoxin